MKLNADIVYESLKERYPVKMMGVRTKELTISHPEMYMDNEVEFLSNHMYIATADHLPLHPKLRKNVVVVAIGDGVKLTHYIEDCCVIVVNDMADFFEVFRFISRVFEKYNNWERELFDIFLGSADLQKIADCSKDIFQCSVHVLDASFHYLTTPDEQAPAVIIEPEQMSQYLDSFDITMERKGAFVLRLSEGTYLCVNLFDELNKYIGCVYMSVDDPVNDGKKMLAEYMAGLMEKAIEKNPAILTSEQATIKRALISLVNEYPLTANQKWKLNLTKPDQRYLCITQHSANRMSRLPKGYICGAFETAFKESYAFAKGNVIVCFLNAAELTDKDGDYHANLNKKLKMFLSETSGIAGVSNAFSDLYSARIAYLQAEAAIENGAITNPETELFYFQTYALVSMVINSMGNMPAEAYFSERLQKLIKHDKNCPVSYLETLRTFLRSGMSYSQTAEELYIHRSTVVDRISRIERDLDVDLKDPDIRLQLEIILKAMEIEEMVQQGRE